MAPSNDPELVSPVRRAIRDTFGWASPSWASASSSLNEADWRSQHDEISKTIWQLTSVLVGASLFCLFVLGAPDASLVSNDAKITIPIASITASYADFLLFGPIFLIGVTLYLHVFIEQRLRLGHPDFDHPASQEPLSPYIFNLGFASADVLSMLLFYAMLPCVLAFFVWKGIPRPEAAWPLTFVFVVVSGLMIALKIRRFAAELQRAETLTARVTLGILWALLAACFVASFPLAWRAGQACLESLRPLDDSAQSAGSRASLRDSAFLQIRHLQLFGADLNKKNLSGFYASHADLRKAGLRNADMEEADLSNADLRKADLTDANLTGANLTGAHLEGADLTRVKFDNADLRGVTVDFGTIMIDIKWRRVICVVNSVFTRECLQRNDLTWTDLSGANLEDSNLTGQQLTGANLQNADLSQTRLDRAILRVADLRNAKLPPSIKNAVIDGALFSKDDVTRMRLFPVSAKVDPALAPYVLALAPDVRAPGTTTVSIKNRATEACIEKPKPAHKGSVPIMAWPCHKTADHMALQLWNAERLNSGKIVFSNPSIGPSACLDGTFANDLVVQVWDCGADFDTQYWRLTPATDGFVTMEKNETGACIDGGETRDFPVVPPLKKCSPFDRNQNWVVADLRPYASEQAAIVAEELRRQKGEHDLQRVIDHYSVGPTVSVYPDRPAAEQNRYRYAGGRLYGQPLPAPHAYSPNWPEFGR